VPPPASGIARALRRFACLEDTKQLQARRRIHLPAPSEGPHPGVGKSSHDRMAPHRPPGVGLFCDARHRIPTRVSTYVGGVDRRSSFTSLIRVATADAAQASPCEQWGWASFDWAEPPRESGR
jgi:hypothetical protein